MVISRILKPDSCVFNVARHFRSLFLMIGVHKEFSW